MQFHNKAAPFLCAVAHAGKVAGCRFSPRIAGAGGRGEPEVLRLDPRPLAINLEVIRNVMRKVQAQTARAAATVEEIEAGFRIAEVQL